MYKLSTYLVVTYFPTYLPTYETYFQGPPPNFVLSNVTRQEWTLHSRLYSVDTMPITRHNGLWVWNLP